MALYADRVLETFATTGTGDITPAGAVLGYQSFSIFNAADVVPYCATDPATGAWEVGEATVLKAPVADSNFANVTVLAHFNGSNGSTTFVNEATISGAPTLSGGTGSTTLSTAGPKFGSASLSVPGPGAGASAPSGVVIGAASVNNIGTGDFTVEMFIKTTYSGYRAIFDYEDSYFSSANSFGLFAYSTGLEIRRAGTSNTVACTAQDNAWHHIAINRVSGTLKLFLDGTSIFSVADTNNYNQSNTKGIRLGSSPHTLRDDFNFGGWIDEFRMTVGVGRYSSNFTPTSTEFGTNLSSGTTTLSRSVTKSSNSNALVSFAAGTKQIFLTPLAAYFSTPFPTVTPPYVAAFADMPTSITGATVASGNYTMGNKYFTGRAVSLLGVRVSWNSSTAATIKVSAFLNGSGTAAATATMTGVSSTAPATILFATAVSLNAGDQVMLSAYDTSGGRYSEAASPSNVPAGTMNSGVLGHMGSGYYVAGDAAPNVTYAKYATLHPVIA